MSILKLTPAGLGAAIALLAAGCTPAAPAGETVAAVTLEQLPPPYNTADLRHGAVVFSKCQNCHSLVAAEGNKQGPNLHGLFARHPATQANFNYSPAMKTHAETIERYTPEEIDRWLTNPRTYVQGTKMFFNGIDDPTERRDVIAYLMVTSTQP
jgi:cytochrome c